MTSSAPVHSTTGAYLMYGLMCVYNLVLLIFYFISYYFIMILFIYYILFYYAFILLCFILVQSKANSSHL